MSHKRNDRKAERRREAEARNTAFAALTPKEQLESLAGRPGVCAKQVRKLNKILAKAEEAISKMAEGK